MGTKETIFSHYNHVPLEKKTNFFFFWEAETDDWHSSHALIHCSRLLSSQDGQGWNQKPESQSRPCCIASRGLSVRAIFCYLPVCTLAGRRDPEPCLELNKPEILTWEASNCFPDFGQLWCKTGLLVLSFSPWKTSPGNYWFSALLSGTMEIE